MLLATLIFGEKRYKEAILVCKVYIQEDLKFKFRRELVMDVKLKPLSWKETAEEQMLY